MSFFADGWGGRCAVGLFLLALLLLIIEISIRSHRRHRARVKLARKAVEEFQQAQLDKLKMQSSARAQSYSIAETYYADDNPVGSERRNSSRHVGELRIEIPSNEDSSHTPPPPPYGQSEAITKLLGAFHNCKPAQTAPGV